MPGFGLGHGAVEGCLRIRNCLMGQVWGEVFEALKRKNRAYPLWGQWGSCGS